VPLGPTTTPPIAAAAPRTAVLPPTEQVRPAMPAPAQANEDAPAAPTGVMDRTLAILELLVDEAAGLPISAIADRLRIPLGATHRLLADLADRGYVRQERGGYRTYRLTTRLASLALRYLAASGITDVAQPVLDRLAAATGELVRLAVVDGDRLTWVAKAQGAQSGLRYDPESGADAQLSCSANGIAWLASMSDAEALARVELQGLGRPEAFGPRAPRTAKALLQHLRATRKRGYSLTIQTFTPWMSAMAAVVRYGTAGDVRGTVSIAGPHIRLTEARMHELAPLLLAAAADLSEASPGSPAFSRARGGPRPDIFSHPSR
jgi:IclR family transcriptional regulator, acetate operon repressor